MNCRRWCERGVAFKLICAVRKREQLSQTFYTQGEVYFAARCVPFVSSPVLPQRQHFRYPVLLTHRNSRSRKPPNVILVKHMENLLLDM